MNALEAYMLTLRAAKAAFVAYTHAPSVQTFALAVEAVNDHQEALARFLKVYSKGIGIDPPEPPTDT